MESDGEFIMAEKYLSGNRLWGTDAERLAMSVSFEQLTQNDSRTFGETGGGGGSRKAVGVKIESGHYLVGKTITQFRLALSQDGDGTGTVKVYVIRDGSTPDDQEAVSDSVTIPSGTGHTSMNTTFTFTSPVTILANDIIAIVRDASTMSGVCAVRTTSSSQEANAQLSMVNETGASQTFEYADFDVTVDNDLQYTASGASPSLPNGSVFITSDTNVHYMWNGTDTWNEVA